jgi:Tfp pilus assembly protein PilV
MQLATSKTRNGFILLEVLVAMSLTLGVWMTSVGSYQGLALRLTQQEEKQLKLRQAFDAYELAEQARANRSQNNSPHISSKGLKNESSRVSGRSRSMRSITESSTAD